MVLKDSNISVKCMHAKIIGDLSLFNFFRSFIIIFLCILFIKIPAQTSTDTIRFEQTIIGRRTIHSIISFVPKVSSDQSITIDIIPEFFHNESKLNERSIRNFRLWYNLEQDKISINPSTYYKLNQIDNDPLRITRSMSLSFNPRDQITEDMVFDFILPLSLFQDIQMLPLQASFNVLVKGLEVKVLIEEDTIYKKKSIEDIEDKDVSDHTKPSKPRTQKEQTSPTQDQSMHEMEDELREIINLSDRIKGVYMQADALRFQTIDRVVLLSQIQSINSQIDQLKMQFDRLYISGSFSDPTTVDRVNNVFSGYYTSTKNILSVLASKAETTTADPRETDIEKTKDQESKGIKTMTYVFLGLAFILILVAIVMITTLIQKKKSVNMQHKLMRKASMELNKQKFNATQHSRQFKI